MIGEVHINTSQLVPNSRRDDFIDNETKTLFYNALERNIGIPISKAIRLQSRLNSSNEIHNTALKSESATHKQPVIVERNNEPLRAIANYEPHNKDKFSDEILKEIMKCCSSCPNFSRIINNASN
jgi:antitoxin component of RelBE/YafQ-DinJ toxin-antitoxin module